MKRYILMLIVVFHFSTASAHRNEYLFVNHNHYYLGMFAVFNYVAGVLYHYDKEGYNGIEVNFENVGLYYDPAYGENWWQYYCEPIQRGSSLNVPIHRFPQNEFDHYAYFTELQLTRYQVHEIIQKYIKVKPHVQKKVADFALKNFKDQHVIAVHYRGTDKGMEVPRVHYQLVDEAIRRYVKEKKLRNYKIFAASDEQQFIDHMLGSFPDQVIVYDAMRSSNGRALHYNNSDHYRQGEDAIVESLLLSKGNVLIRTSSNLSLWSTYFSPNMPVIELSHR